MCTFCAQTAKYLSQLQEEKISLKKLKMYLKLNTHFLNFKFVHYVKQKLKLDNI